MFVKKLSILSVILLIAGNVYAGDVVLPKTFINGEILTHTDLNAQFDSIVIEVNDLDGDNLASDIDITTSGDFVLSGSANLSGTLVTTGTSVSFGDGADEVIYNSSGGITYTPAATWTFTADQTINGTWDDLGIVTTVDINGGSIDAITLGTNSAVTSAVITTADINGGSFDNGSVGATTPSGGTFTTLGFNTSFTDSAGTVVIDGIFDQDSMAAASATNLFTGEAIKAYVDLHGTEEFTADGTFTVPGSVTKVFLTMVGGGGAGGGTSAAGHDGGGGGGGGALIMFPYEVTPTATLTVQVGVGGTGQDGATNNGEDTIFDTGGGAITASGGTGGAHAYPNGAGGAGGAEVDNLDGSGTSGGDFTPGGKGAIAGGDGGDGAETSGGGGGASIMGDGGTGKSGGDGDGASASESGEYGGGGGGAEQAGAGTYKGGDGADGIVIVTW